jgi:hypothetical protein
VEVQAAPFLHIGDVELLVEGEVEWVGDQTPAIGIDEECAGAEGGGEEQVAAWAGGRAGPTMAPRRTEKKPAAM